MRALKLMLPAGLLTLGFLVCTTASLLSLIQSPTSHSSSSRCSWLEGGVAMASRTLASSHLSSCLTWTSE